MRAIAAPTLLLAVMGAVAPLLPRADAASNPPPNATVRTAQAPATITQAPATITQAPATITQAPATITQSVPGTNPGRVDPRLLAVGAGAIVGVVAFNVLSAPLGIVPFAGGTLAAVPSSVALGSRLIAVATAGAGALGANWLYDRWTGEPSDYRYLVTLGAGALAGVAAGNYLAMGTVGTAPYYIGAGVANAAGELASPAAQAASRVYVIGSAVLGAWAADWLSRR